MVEFILILPLLLVLLLGVADFGRVFAAGISMEAATRNGAEAAAQEYVQILRTNGSLSASDYQHLHALAIDAVCHEASVLPGYLASGTSCSMPATAVCIHDATGSSFGPDPNCGGGTTGAPAQCGSLSSGWDVTNAQGSGALAYVEVRTCYRFTTIDPVIANLRLPFGNGLSLGDVYLQRTRTFAIACYHYSGPC